MDKWEQYDFILGLMFMSGKNEYKEEFFFKQCFSLVIIILEINFLGKMLVNATS